MSFNIPFNKPWLTGNETDYIKDAVASGKISGGGQYSRLCQEYLERRDGFGKCLLTTSCTDALEMAAILLDIQPGDEVILPSYTFVSTANAFVLRGARLVFADSRPDHPGMDEACLEALITPKTKAIVPVHYAGVACDMDVIMEVADRHRIFVVEDAAQAIDSHYTFRDGSRKALGSIGHLAAFSFHETKNIISGEGGMLAINDMQFAARAEIIWEKGTNRSAFFRGEIDKYGWVDMGSSFLPSEIIAAFLWAQLENLDNIQQQRIGIWNRYWELLSEKHVDLGLQMPVIPDFAQNNAHMFYVVCRNLQHREALTNALKTAGVHAVFHYLSLHSSPFYRNKHDGRALPHSDRYSDVLLRLPMYYELGDNQITEIVSLMGTFLEN